MPYKIKEKWRISGGIEEYESDVKNLKQVREYIKDWMENWEGNVEDLDDSKITKTETDYRTYAKIVIRTNIGSEYFEHNDILNLKVEKVGYTLKTTVKKTWKKR